MSHTSEPPLLFDSSSDEKLAPHQHNPDDSRRITSSSDDDDDGYEEALSQWIAAAQSNGMINCSKQIDLDDLGFRPKNLWDHVSDAQREGRCARVTDSLILHLGKSVDDPCVAREPDPVGEVVWMTFEEYRRHLQRRIQPTDIELMSMLALLPDVPQRKEGSERYYLVPVARKFTIKESEAKASRRLRRSGTRT